MKDRIKKMAVILKSLGDEKRLKIIKLLASNIDETFCVSDIAMKLGISQPAASQHIKVLKNIGLLEENRKGFKVFYSIDSVILAKYRKDTNELFRKAFEKCQHNFSCDQCFYNNNCK
jgi:ArsR family transcriptional regulator, arsenate/arsenite/antimonite-responsive transcriptional repressor